MKILQWFARKKGEESQAAESMTSQAERQIDVGLDKLVCDLQEYSSVLQMLVQSLDSHTERRTINSYLQRLADYDLGLMLIQASIPQVTDTHYLQRLQEVLNEINSRANSAGKHLKGGARPAASLQEIVNRASSALEQGDLPPAIYMLLPNILMVTKSTLSHIETRLKTKG